MFIKLFFLGFQFEDVSSLKCYVNTQNSNSELGVLTECGNGVACLVRFYHLFFILLL